jgi:Helix-turn-helix domain
MATLTVVEAARVTGVSRSQLYRYIKAGKLSRTPEGLIDTAELLRAGLLLHVPSVPLPVPAAHDATVSAVSPVPEAVSPVPSADTATLERLIAVLQRELDAARERETLLTQRMHARETQLLQVAHERETQLLQLLAQLQQQNQRLLDMPRPPPPTSPSPAREPMVSRTVPSPGDPRGEMRRRIVALLQEHPEGLTPAEMRTLLGVDRRLVDTCAGMVRYGLLQRVGQGRYVAAEPSRHDST